MNLVVSAQPREALGTRSVGRLRNEGKIPAVIYGKGKPNQNIMLDGGAVGQSLQNAVGKLVTLKQANGASESEEQVLITNLQHHPVKRNIIHIDFFRVAMDRPVTVKVSVQLVNEGQRENDGAILETLLHQIEVTCLPGLLPDQIAVDVSALNIGETIQVRELKLPSGIKVETSPNDVIVVAAAPRVAVEPEPAEAVAGRELVESTT